MSRRVGADRGSVLVLALGLVVVVVLVVAVATDAAAVFLRRRELAAVADSAALAAAQQVDLAAYYAGTPVAALPLDRAAVAPAVRRYLVDAGARARLPGLVVESVRTDGRVVTVTLRCRADLPFAGLLRPGTSALVRVTASAMLRVR